MNPIDSYDLEVVQQLEKLKAVPRRNAQKALASRAAFLGEARELAQGVSIPREMRPIGWKQKLNNLFSIRKERSPMFTTLTTILVALTLIFGGGGITLASAQNSMPDQPLYNLKLWTEEMRYNLTSDPQAAWQLSLAFADRRAAEVQAMFSAEQTIPERVQERYRSQVEQTIRLADGLPEEQGLNALTQTRERLRLQEQTLNQLQLQNDPQAQVIRERMRLMLQERVNWVDGDIERRQQRQRQGSPAQPAADESPTATSQPTATVEAPIAPSPGSGYGPGDGTCDGCTPNAGENNPWTTGVPTPGSGYGPGPGDGTCDDCKPNAGENNPWTTSVPTPGSSYGPGSGDGSCDSCTPKAGESNPWTTSVPTPDSSYGPGPNPTQDGGNNGGKTQDTQPKPTQNQPQSTPKGPGSQKSPGG